MVRAARNAWWWLRQNIGAQECFVICGVLLLARGLEEIYHPLLWITPGVAILVLAWPVPFGHWFSKPRRDR